MWTYDQATGALKHDDAPAGKPYRRLLLNIRHPQRTAIRKVTVNGRPHTDFTDGIVRLPAGAKRYVVEIGF
jgi:hypothetical protein